LTGAEPRGLPGTTIDRIELQRAAEGYPLDDVILHAHDARGNSAVLEIQVKRSITFTPTDPVFRAVVNQIVEASRRTDFWTTRHELAIAIARTSHKIDGAYQDVLIWARQLVSAATFIGRIERPGSANDDMRTFVRTFRSHLHEAGAADDDETVWQLLRKLRRAYPSVISPGQRSAALEAAGNEFGAKTLGMLNGLSRRFWYANYERSADLPRTARLQAAVARAIGNEDDKSAAAATDELIDHIQEFTRRTIG
jgi:hypothetical protein